VDKLKQFARLDRLSVADNLNGYRPDCISDKRNQIKRQTPRKAGSREAKKGIACAYSVNNNGRECRGLIETSV
jgi:hypothetical protein